MRTMLESQKEQKAEEKSELFFGSFRLIPLEKIYLMLEDGEYITGILMINVKDDLREKREKLKDIIAIFENSYHKEISDWTGEITIFDNFHKIVDIEFRKSMIYSYQIPSFLEKQEIENKYDFDFIKYIDGKNSIQDIVNMSEENTHEIFRLLRFWKYDMKIELSSKIEKNTVFEPSKELFYLLRSRNPENPDFESGIYSTNIEFKVLSKIDGLRSVDEIINKTRNDDNIDEQKILETISKYASKQKYMKKIELCPLIIKINEKVKNKFSGIQLALIYTLENLCDGEKTIEEIMEKTGVDFKEIKTILNKLGDDVSYRKKREIIY